jgi:hypothetical protein
LAERYPEKVTVLAKEWQQWADDMGVVNWQQLISLDKID